MNHVTRAATLAAFALTLSGIARSGDREVAEQIGKHLRESGKLQNYSINVKYKDGTAWLSGRVSSPQQVAAAADVAGSYPEVTNVVNQLQVAARGTAAPAAGQTTKSSLWPVRRASVEAPRSSFDPSHVTRPQPAPRMMPAAARMPSRPIRRVDHVVEYPSEGPYPYAPEVAMNMGGRPLPAYVHGSPGAAAPAKYDHPYMPNYAWPSYAPYPNYAALTYPKQYSPTAWPYIGPFYPYPQVPLGWRKVTLEWDDGWWFLDFKDDPSNCWKDCCN
jgi:hypothetical protein